MSIHLLKAEFLQLLYRRRVVAVFFGLVIFGLLIPVSYIGFAMPASDEEVLLAEDMGWTCAGCVEDLPEVWSITNLVNGGMYEYAMLFALFALVVGALYVGSDFVSGAIGTQLTFTPRRGQLLVIRSFAVGVLGSVLVGAALLAMCSVTLLWYVGANGFEAVGSPRAMVELLIAGTVLGFFGGAIGALLAFPGAFLAILGSFGTALGVSVLLLITGPIVISDQRILWERIMPWNQGGALLLGQKTYFISYAWGYPSGYEVVITRAEAVLYFLGLLALLGLVSLLAFRRRDV